MAKKKEFLKEKKRKKSRVGNAPKIKLIFFRPNFCGQGHSQYSAGKRKTGILPRQKKSPKKGKELKLVKKKITRLPKSQLKKTQKIKLIACSSSTNSSLVFLKNQKEEKKKPKNNTKPKTGKLMRGKFRNIE